MNEPSDVPSDEVLVDVFAEHFLNVIQAVAASVPAIQGSRVLQLASRAIAELDLLASVQFEPPRDRVASPLHDLADVALDRLSSTLHEMRVTDAVRVEGYTLDEPAARMLSGLRKLVTHHRALVLTGTRPVLVVPHSAQIREA